MKAEMVETIVFLALVVVAILASLAWSVFGMVRIGQWWANKEKWRFGKWDNIWSFHTNIKFLARFEAGKMSNMKALYAFTMSLFVFMLSAAFALMVAAKLFSS